MRERGVCQRAESPYLSSLPAVTGRVSTCHMQSGPLTFLSVLLSWVRVMMSRLVADEKNTLEKMKG